MPLLLSPPKEGRRIKGIERFLLTALKNDGSSYLLIPGFFHIGNVTWEFIRYLGDIKATLYTYDTVIPFPSVYLLLQHQKA